MREFRRSIGTFLIFDGDAARPELEAWVQVGRFGRLSSEQEPGESSYERSGNRYSCLFDLNGRLPIQKRLPPKMFNGLALVGSERSQRKAAVVFYAPQLHRLEWSPCVPKHDDGHLWDAGGIGDKSAALPNDVKNVCHVEAANARAGVGNVPGYRDFLRMAGSVNDLKRQSVLDGAARLVGIHGTKHQW
jgi:hypothetical protein